MATLIRQVVLLNAVCEVTRVNLALACVGRRRSVNRQWDHRALEASLGDPLVRARTGVQSDSIFRAAVSSGPPTGAVFAAGTRAGSGPSHH